MNWEKRQYQFDRKEKKSMRNIQKQNCFDDWQTVRSGEEGQDNLTIDNLGNWLMLLPGLEIGNTDE